MIPAPPADPLAAAAAERDRDPVCLRYRALFALLDWRRVPERDPTRRWPGPRPHPAAAYVRALLVAVVGGLSSATELRRYLLDHPLLVLELGFRPVPDPDAPFGFAVGRTVPGDRWLRRQRQALPADGPRALLAGTVADLLAAAPGLGETVSVDVTHLAAWVRENNPREAIPHRFAPGRIPRGDPDCRLGAKAAANQRGAKAGKAWLWGYGSGIAAATHPAVGDVVLAEATQTFNHQDVAWFAPVHARAVANPGFHPTNLAADAAFDAWSVYEACAGRGGIAAVAANRRGAAPARSPEGRPLCDRGLATAPTTVTAHGDGYRVQNYGCPLLRPTRTGETCGDGRFARGRGCRKCVTIEAGGLARASVDRGSDAYRAVYRQRTATERIFSRAKGLGLGSPRVRCAAAVERLATLTYVAVNLQALHRLAGSPAPT